MNSLQKAGGIAALLQAGAHVAGLIGHPRDCPGVGREHDHDLRAGYDHLVGLDGYRQAASASRCDEGV